MSIFGTEIMKSNECLLFIKTAIDNGSSKEEALDDMIMIDNLLSVERNHLLSFGSVKKTTRGHYRKGTTLSNALMNVINSRIENK